MANLLTKSDGNILSAADLNTRLTAWEKTGTNSAISVLNDLKTTATSGYTVTNPDQFVYDLMADQTKVASNYGLVFDSTNKRYSLPAYSSNYYYIDITATNYTGTTDSDVTVFKVAASTWRVLATAGDTLAKNKVRVYKKLWNTSITGQGTNGIVGATSVTDVRSSDSSDRGKKVLYLRQHQSSPNPGCPGTVQTMTVSLNNASSMTAWIQLQGSFGGGNSIIEVAEGSVGTTLRNRGTLPSTCGTQAAFDGLSTSSPASDSIASGTSNLFRLNTGQPFSGDTTDSRAILFYDSGSTASIATSGSSATFVYSTETTISSSAPADGLDGELITNSLATITTANTLVLPYVETSFAATTSLAVKASFDGGTNYETITHKRWSQMTNLGTSLKLKLTITRTDTTTSTDYLKNYGAFYV